ncbi:diphosphomevalonate decarboxylase [Enterococcus sp. PF1-24]|uniref:diphosphomevalonate decarboxylase n=1 Tax=unclassified Enterococcus TaxID=2608891 RepID=UPI002473FDEF|nr:MULTISPECIES: diphosphomevalonate decarboxylase [unclassified Enterococcus]MDH6363947.1 diphosphomevalonate decarboxylase [Enterococcus sp. PFB1-1]MDH6401048.1 diphosphomevalonate decarboxylase [Enterococcus sp. PF1-24]
MLQGKARAYTNIALIKYWGKKDEDLIIPMNSSLSLTLDAFYSETQVTFDPQLTEDIFYLDGNLETGKSSEKTSQFLDKIRQIANIKTFAKIESQNCVPTAAGLASSASGLAALAGACNAALELNLSEKDLSRLARKGSGSACRSIFGGFAEWVKGDSDENSFAESIAADGWEDELAMIFILINDQAKDVSSRDGMRRTVLTSPFYQGWLTAVTEDLATTKTAIATKDFTLLGATAEANALKMHATTLGANPPFTYWSPDSLFAMNQVRQLRQQGYDCYFTMDAGPNVKILTKKSQVPALLQELNKVFAKEKLITAQAGPGIQIF